MTEQHIQRAVEELVALALAGKGADAWEKYYHAEVEKVDLDGVSIHGKGRVLEENHSLLARITAVRTYAQVGVMVKGQRSFLVWDVDFDVKDAGTVKATEVCIHDWQDGLIIRERFFA